MDNKKFYIADLHLYHKNVTKSGKDFDDRPFADIDEMNRAIVDNWNKAVTNADHVYILGDFIWRTFSNSDESLALLKSLNGNLHLIRGNHDGNFSAAHKKRFEEICDYKKVEDVLDGNKVTVVMSHYYIPFYEGHYRGNILLHGHSHNSEEAEAEFEMTENLRNNFSPIEIYNVGCMYPYMDYTPRTLQEVKDGFNYHKRIGTKFFRSQKTSV